ncbi:hypothetical protein QN277_028858 [Acacia crassicarpa]|uniref:Uncharacterized protein n=1 Tax=Acacia crassicarpa TaxID=499986 RepID=A0AAE1J7H7_9FABA|nr:hypothetical protein QN277_028858 [Acacia crassicarpa]
MAANNFFLSRTKSDSANTWFTRELLYRNMIWLLGSLQLFLCNYVVCLFAMAINFFARFLVEGYGKAERCCEIDGFREELTNFLFQCHEDVFEVFGIGVEKTQSSPLMEAISDVDREKKKNEGGALLMEVPSAFQKDTEKEGGETESSVSMEVCSDNHEDENKSEGETDFCVSMEVHSDSHEIKEKKKETESIISEVHVDETEKFVSQKVQFVYTENGNKKETKSESSSISMNVHCDLPESKKEGETESLVSMTDQSDSHENEEKGGKSSVLIEVQSQHKGEGEISCVLMEANSATTTQKYEHVSGKDIRGFIEEPTSMRFTFQEFFVGPNVPVMIYNNAKIISQKQESSQHPKEEEAESTQENWFLGCNNSQKGIEAVSVTAAREERAEESGKERSNQEPENKPRGKAEEWKKMMEELENEVGSEWRMEWEHDDIVEQLKIELRNARQGGLSTIIEEQEEEEDEEEEDEEEEEREGETGHAEEAGDHNLQNNEENEEHKDQMVEIEEVYQIYEDKMRKLDALNYQTMHGLGLLQLKESAKSSFKGMKPLISQNLWRRKEAKTPLMKLVQELQRDLEVVYVGQVCLSWDILCWLHKKALQIKQHYYQSQAHHPPHFNAAAGEFQLFQVLLQRFIENEAFQVPRTINFVKNRCVIRNLLQVPPIRDDSAKEKNITKGGEEDFVVSIARLAEIIKESIWLFWRFVRADKEDGNLILKVSQQNRNDPKDPAISDLVKDIRAHLHKKEKKLKDLVRTRNCIVRKFQKHQQQQEDQLNHEQLLAQVELKLVSRILNLSKLRKEHLIWCNEKLKRIKFVMKKKEVVVEPSFLLFPC